MDTYFLSLTDRLTIDEIELLNQLTSSESTNRFSAKTKKELFHSSKLTESRFRKILYRLEALRFIEIVAGAREHLIFVTEYGQNAIQCIYERGNV
jgi:DNA-binding MarR family transcriptional regulator